MEKDVIGIDGKNYFNNTSFEEACKELEKGNKVRVYISCIGYTRAIMEGNTYTTELRKKYGDRLEEFETGFLNMLYFKLKEIR